MMIELWLVGSALGLGFLSYGKTKMKNITTSNSILLSLFAFVFSWFAIGVIIAVVLDEHWEAKK